MKQFIFIFSFVVYSSLVAQNVQINNNWWHPNGEVLSITKDTAKGIAYIGGDFSSVGPVEPNGTMVDVNNGSVDFSFPNPNAPVNVAVSDGNGGMYICGDFFNVGDSVRWNIAHINSSGNVTSWNPGIRGDISTMVKHNNTLYIGGSFSYFSNGLVIDNLCAIDATTGNIIPWNPNPNLPVNTISISGSTIYIGGSFNMIGNLPRMGFAAIDIGLSTANALTMNVNGTVNSIVIDSSIIYLGGDFTTVNNQPRNSLASIDSTSSILTTWNPNVTGVVNVLKVSDTTIFVGGAFTNIGNGIGGNALPYLASVNKSTGGVNNWNANISVESHTVINTIELNGSSLFLGGVFNEIGGQQRRNLAEIDLSGNILSWAPISSGEVFTLEVYNNSAFVGGDFNSIGGEIRYNIAAFDGTSGSLLNWTPIINGAVETVGFSGSSVYISGNFTTVGGVSRSGGLAEIDTSLGVATIWNPIFSGKVNAFAFYGNYVFLGGDFDNFGGGANDNLVKINHTTKFIESFNLNITTNTSHRIETMLISGDTLYFGGKFSSGFPNSRSNLASVNILTENVTNFSPGPNGVVTTLVDNGSNIIVGGDFTLLRILGTANNLVELNKVTVSRTTWNPNPNGDIFAAEIFGNDVYISGSFSTISGQPKYKIARLDLLTGLPQPLITNFSGNISSICALGSTVILGGDFNGIGQNNASNLMAYSANLLTNIEESTKKTIGEEFKIYPNPTKGNFTIQAKGLKGKIIHFSITDMQGRIIEQRTIMNSTKNIVNELFNLNGRDKGAYFVSIRNESSVLVRKLILTGSDN